MKIAFSIIGIFVLIFLGACSPIWIFKIPINQASITPGELWYNIATSIGVVVTIMTVIVALFKEDLIRIFKHADLKSDFIDQTTLREELEEINGTKTASKYYCAVELRNNGNISAENCELYLDKINYVLENKSKALLKEPRLIQWKDKRERIYIPSSGYTTFHVIELFPPQKSSTPDGQTIKSPATLKIHGYDVIDMECGSVECHYTIHSSSIVKPVRFSVRFDWNGTWERRLTEMQSNVTINLEQK